MRLRDVLYKTPEMTEEKLLKIIDENRKILNMVQWSRNKYNSSEEILKEYDLVQDKKSNLTKSQRDLIVGFVGACMIKMVKDNGGTSDGGSSSESTSEN